MNLLQIIDLLCDVTTKQSDLLRRLVTDMENMDQVSEEMKASYKQEFDHRRHRPRLRSLRQRICLLQDAEGHR